VIVMPIFRIQLLSKAYIGARSSREANGRCCYWIAPKLYDPGHSGALHSCLSPRMPKLPR
jgi:hypothetical protein